jgi:phosphoserine aminotransferase
MLNYREHIAGKSLFNTPPTFAIYVLNLITRWLLNDIGGLEKMDALNRRKAARLYQVIDDSEGFYQGHAAPECRSLMNVTFRLPSDELTKAFTDAAKQRDLVALAGHRSVGGIRASIYNAMPEEGVALLAEFMQEFKAAH